MKKHCQNQYCENESAKKVPVSVKKASDQKRAVCAACEGTYTWGVQQGRASVKGLIVDPPPCEDDEEPLFRVVYMIDVNGADARDAADYTYRIMSDPDSMPPVLNILDCKGNETVVDLSGESAEEQILSQPEEPRCEARKFVKAAATKCPKCSSESVNFKAVDIEGQSAYQQASCQDCETRFYSAYRLVGFGLYVDEVAEVYTIAEDFGEIKAED